MRRTKNRRTTGNTGIHPERDGEIKDDDRIELERESFEERRGGHLRGWSGLYVIALRMSLKVQRAPPLVVAIKSCLVVIPGFCEK